MYGGELDTMGDLVAVQKEKQQRHTMGASERVAVRRTYATNAHIDEAKRDLRSRSLLTTL